tara:strand:+ start:100 stop:360 length:261 start_codon:yes stop_codon:yes gene_type:complete
MDEGAAVSEITLRVIPAQHRLPPSLLGVKCHDLVGSPDLLTHLRMGEGALSGSQEPAGLSVLANARFVRHRVGFEWFWLSVESVGG